MTTDEEGEHNIYIGNIVLLRGYTVAFHYVFFGKIPLLLPIISYKMQWVLIAWRNISSLTYMEKGFVL